MKVTAINLNDDTVAAIRHGKLPFIGVQYIPGTAFYTELVQTIKDVKAGKYNA
jgi:carbamoylphosphate synthase small subunit